MFLIPIDLILVNIRKYTFNSYKFNKKVKYVYKFNKKVKYIFNSYTFNFYKYANTYS